MKKVIALLGATAIVLAGLWGNAYIKRGRIVQAQKAMAEISTLVLTARANTNLSTDNITHNGCSFCPCRTQESHRDDPVNSICAYNWNNVMLSVWRALGKEGYPPEHLLRDPWGSPYGMDEDDTNAPCLADKLVSFGPDGRFGTQDDISVFIRDPQCK